MSLRIFVAVTFLMSAVVSFKTMAAESLNINMNLVSALATIKETSGMATFFKKYHGSLNSKIITWSIDKGNSPDKQGKAYSLVFILCSAQLNEKNQCTSPQLIVETHSTSNEGLKSATATFVDQENFIFTLSSNGDVGELNKPFPPYSYVKTEDTGLIVSLAQLRINNDSALASFFNKPNIVAALTRILSITKVTSESKVSYKIGGIYYLRDYYSENPCGFHDLEVSPNSSANYVNSPQTHQYCHPSNQPEGYAF